MSRQIAQLIAAAALVSFATMGCTKARPVDETHEGSLEEGDELHDADGSYYDEYDVRVKEGWSIVVEMESEDFDTYLQLYPPSVTGTESNEEATGMGFIENDDVEPGNTNSRIETEAVESGRYRIIANSYSAGMTGDYTIRIRADESLGGGDEAEGTPLAEEQPAREAGE